jgi:hypothetical protein
MSFGGKGKTTRGFTISGLNETLGGIDSFMEDLHTRTRRAILTDAATFYKNDAVKNAHVITGKTRDSIKIESVSDDEAVISAGFGMPYEEKRPGNKVRSQNKKRPSGDAVINSVAESILSAIVGIGTEGGIRGGNTPHATMTEAAKRTTKEMPSIIDKHMNDLLNRHKAKTVT